MKKRKNLFGVKPGLRGPPTPRLWRLNLSHFAHSSFSEGGPCLMMQMYSRQCFLHNQLCHKFMTANVTKQSPKLQPHCKSGIIPYDLRPCFVNEKM
jgi:hypothetical protein